MFIDFNKALDSEQHWAVWEALNKHGVSEDIVGVLNKMYEKTTAYVRLVNDREIFVMEKGVKQGNPFSSTCLI